MPRIQLLLNIGSADAKALDIGSLPQQGAIVEASDAAAKKLIARSWGIPVEESDTPKRGRSAPKPADE